MAKVKIEKLNEIKETFFVSWRMLKLVWQVDRKLFTAAFVSKMVPAVIPFVNIYIYKLIIDLVVGVVGGASLSLNTLYFLIALRIITYFIQEVSFRTQELVDRLYWTKVPIFLNQIFLKKLTDLEVIYFEDPQFRNLMEKAKESLNYRPQQLIDNLFYFFQSSVQFLIAFVALASLNWFFIILIIVVTIPEFINQNFYTKLAWGIWSENSPHRKRFDYLLRILQGPREFKEVKIFQLAGKMLTELKNLQDKFYVENKGLAKKYYGTSLVYNGLSSLVFVGIEIFVIFQALARRVTVGDINFYTGVVSNFQYGLSGALRTLNNVFEHSLYVKSMFEILDAKPLLKQAKHPVKLNLRKPPKIEFKEVEFIYPGSKDSILKGFNLIINPGEKVAFVGENGVGKTTVIKLLARFYDVSKGEILVNGHNLKSVELTNWYKNIGILFQDFNKYEHTVKENIYFGKVFLPINLKKIIEAATSAGANSMIEKFDQKYDQILGKIFEGGVELSGGQWQKIALSRAFYRSAPILVLDEPTASLDAKAESEIFSRVERLSKGKTVIIISHRFSTVRAADKIYVIGKGRIVEGGTHEQLIKLGGQYATMFNLQAKGYM